MRSAVLTLASVGLTLAVLGNAWVQRQQFYPSVVYITKSNPSMAVIYLQSLVVVVLLGKVMRKIFFGQLRAAEFEHLMERSWYAVTETCLAFTVFKDDFSPKFVALFVLLLFLKSFHWLAEDRVDFMERSPVITLVFHLRVLSLAIVLASLDILFIQNAYQSTITKGASVQLVFGFEYAILMTIVANTVVKYVLHSVDLYSEAPWENKAVFMLYTELFIGLVKVMLYVMFFVIMVRIYTLPLFAVRPMYLTMRAFKKAFNDVLLSRRAIHNMNTMYPDATAEELTNSDNVCIICREEMAAPTAKKLPCNHIFHKNCLRSWFQRQQTCPTCRLDVLRPPTLPQPQHAAAAAAAPQPAAAAAFQQQMAALRAQLEAMQQQRQQQHQQQQLYNIMAGGVVPPPAATVPPSTATTTPPDSTSGSGASGGSPPPFSAGVGAARSPPFLFPPFPFMPWAVPPPMPPPNFQGLSDAELLQMEGTERQHVEARIRCLRNIQVLLDAAVMEMQQYSAVVARSTAQQNLATTVAPAAAATTASPSTAAPSSPTAAVSAAAPVAAVASVVPPAAAPVSAVASAVPPAVAAAAPTAGNVAAGTTMSNKTTGETIPNSSSGEAEPDVKSYIETGARPKVKDVPMVVTPAVEAARADPAAISSSCITAVSSSAAGEVRTSEQEEMRRRRLAVFEEQKRRLMKNNTH